jgi:hypothetical protein
MGNERRASARPFGLPPHQHIRLRDLRIQIANRAQLFDLRAADRSFLPLSSPWRVFLRDVSLRNRFGNNAWVVARQKFSADDVRERFRKMLVSAIR